MTNPNADYSVQFNRAQVAETYIGCPECRDYWPLMDYVERGDRSCPSCGGDPSDIPIHAIDVETFVEHGTVYPVTLTTCGVCGADMGEDRMTETSLCRDCWDDGHTFDEG